MGEVVLAKRLAYLRENNEITQYKLGKIIGVTRVSISKWENSKEFIPIKKAIAIANFFEVSVDYLFGLSDNKEYYQLNLTASGKRIVKFRKMHNLTLRNLANILNTTSSTISAYETGKTLILSSFAYEIALKYNVSIDWLLGAECEMYLKRPATIFKIS